MTEKNAAGDQATILVVDDDALIAMDMAGMLADLGHATLEAYSGAEAMAIIESGARVDAVITDFGMPGMSGLELAEKMRSIRPGLPVMVASGYTELPQESGYPHIGKPFDGGQLAAALSAAFGVVGANA